HGLDRGNIRADAPIVLVAVDLPSGLQHEQPEALELYPRLGHRLLDELFGCQRAALRVARDGTLAHHVQCAPREADGAHRMVDTTTAESCLRNSKRTTSLAK